MPSQWCPDSDSTSPHSPEPQPRSSSSLDSPVTTTQASSPPAAVKTRHPEAAKGERGRDREGGGGQRHTRRECQQLHSSLCHGPLNGQDAAVLCVRQGFRVVVKFLRGTRVLRTGRHGAPAAPPGVPNAHTDKTDRQTDRQTDKDTHTHK